MTDEIKFKAVKESKIEMIEIMLPNDANTLGNVFGGRIMSLIDIAGGVAAMRHCRKSVVTASVGDLHFISPIKIGYMVILEAVVIYTGRTSLEVEVTVWSENPITGERKFTSHAHLTYVALGSDGSHVEVPKVVPETEDEKKRYEDAKKRKEERIARKSFV